jgi:hypothetical protein
MISWWNPLKEVYNKGNYEKISKNLTRWDEKERVFLKKMLVFEKNAMFWWKQVNERVLNHILDYMLALCLWYHRFCFIQSLGMNIDSVERISFEAKSINFIQTIRLIHNAKPSDLSFRIVQTPTAGLSGRENIFGDHSRSDGGQASRMKRQYFQSYDHSWKISRTFWKSKLKGRLV